MGKADSYILVIDDSITNQVLMAALLEEEGFAVRSVSSMAEAHTLIERRKPCLILLDLLMPQVGGMEGLTQFKRGSETGDIPVIVVTAVPSDEHREACMTLGALDYYTKPIDIPQFVRRIGSILSY